jgi:hypothetical protein
VYVLGWNGRPNYYGNSMMKIYEVCSDIAAICLEMGGNFFPVPNDVGSDGGFFVTVVDKTDAVPSYLRPCPDGPWDLYNTFQVNRDDVYLHWSDCARLDDGVMASYHKRLHKFDKGNYSIYRESGNFLFRKDM